MPVQRILVPTDFSESSLGALDFAVEYARRLGCECILLHVLESFYLPAPGDGRNLALVYRKFEDAAREQLSHVAAGVRRSDLALRTLVRRGPAHRVIVDTAKRFGVDLIVMSTQGRSGLAHALMGSVAEKVVRTAPCPVLTLRGASDKGHFVSTARARKDVTRPRGEGSVARGRARGRAGRGSPDARAR